MVISIFYLTFLVSHDTRVKFSCIYYVAKISVLSQKSSKSVPNDQRLGILFSALM